MTQEDKELLLKDLCARLPYGIVVRQSAQYSENHFMYSIADKWKKEPHDFKIIGIDGTNTLIVDKRKKENSYAKGIVSSPITICIYNNLTKQITKPYLRPMSSMTEEEKKEYKHLVAFSGSPKGAANLVDWLNKKMFAYRTLDGKDMFELGLALEAPEGMYKEWISIRGNLKEDKEGNVVGGLKL